MVLKKGAEVKKIIIFLVIFGVFSFCGRITFCSGESLKSCPENTALNKYFEETKQMYLSLQNKYAWAKGDNVNPSQESESFVEDVLHSHQSRTIDEAYDKLPWSGWIRKWNIKFDSLKNKIEAVKTTTTEGYKLKKKMMFVLSNAFMLGGQYADALSGQENDIKYFKDAADSALKDCEEIIQEFPKQSN